MRFRKKYNLAFALVILLICSSLLFPGDASRIGTTAGVQVQVPVGGRTFGMSGADIANTSSVDAIYWNPAGLGNIEASGAGFFSSSKIIADINVNYFSVALSAGKIGNIGISLKSFDFGDIPITTVEDMDGDGGATYSPTFSTIGLSYARHLSDKINVGITGKVIYESIPRAEATSLAFDVGIQYQNLMDIENLAIGLVVQNVGQNMEYGGSGLLTEANEGDTFDNFFGRSASSDQLPTSLKMGMSYKVGPVLAAVSYLANNNQRDELLLGGEFNLANILYLRGGYSYAIEDPDNEGIGETAYSLTGGAGLRYDLGNFKLIVDYVYRPTEDLGNESIIAFGIGF